jgi:BASS family bile acid:Na+ symporter
MGRLLAFLGGHATQVLCIGVFLGLALPGLAAVVRPLLAPSVVALLTAALLRVDWRAMGDYARRPWLTSALVLWLLLVSPVILWLMLRLAPLPGELNTALILMAAGPPILVAASIAMMLGLDGALAIVASLITTLLTPLTLPPLALALLDLELSVGVVDLMLRLTAVVAAAFAGAAVIRRLAGPAWLTDHAPHIDGVIVVFMLIFAVAIMDGVTAALIARPWTVALWTAAAFVANPLLQVLGMVVFGWLGRRGALTVGLLSGNCNMGLLLAALPPGEDFDVVLYFALAQLPMYMLPAALLPIYRRLLARTG